MDLFDKENYKLDDKEQFFDIEKNQAIEKEEIPPFEIIKAIAKKYKYEIQEPRKGCKHCYGRGYTGFDAKTKQPIPCNCIFKFEDRHSESALKGKWNRKQRRLIEQEMKRKNKHVDKNKIIEEAQNAIETA